MSRYDLLPPNATALERDFSRSISSLERVGSPVPTIRTAKRVDIPDAVVPWLIYEYGLGELLPYLVDQRQALAEGVQWQRVRGTPAALKIALGWIGLDALLEESEAGTLRWAEYQLGLEQAPPDLAFVARAIEISRISAPVRSRLFRIYGGYDERRFLLDHHLLGEGLLCDDSGVKDLQPGWPQLSFGREFEALIAAGVSVQDAYTHIFGYGVFYPDTFRLDFGVLDEEWHVLNHPLVRSTGRVSVAYLGTSTNSWNDDTWIQPGNWGAYPGAIMPPGKFAKAQVVLSDSWVLGEINSCLPATTMVEVGNTIELSGDAISDTYWALEFAEINERIFRDHGSQAITYTGPDAIVESGQRTITGSASLFNLPIWTDDTWQDLTTWFHGYAEVGAAYSRTTA